MIGNPDRNFRREAEIIAEQGSIVHAPPRRTVRWWVRWYWPWALLAMAGLTPWLWLVATGHVGN